jgi:hypothetical protein
LGPVRLVDDSFGDSYLITASKIRFCRYSGGS